MTYASYSKCLSELHAMPTALRTSRQADKYAQWLHQKPGVEMNRTCLHLSLVTVSALATSWLVPANANNFVQSGNKLPDATSIYRSPLRIQIVDTGPKVTDTRHGADTTQYVINVPPMPQGSNQIIQIGGNNSPGKNGTLSSDSPLIPVVRNSLPASGLHSHIKDRSPATGRALPPGTSTGGLKASSCSEACYH